MFGYEIADLLLFDLETFDELYQYYLSAHQKLFYLGLAANILAVFLIKRFPRLVGIFLGGCWAIPGYLFYVQQFSEIYWPASYVGLLAICIGGVQVIESAITQTQVTESSRWSFALGSLLPAITSWAFGSTVLALGTSVTVGALSTLGFHISSKNWTSRLLVGLSLLWCAAASFVWWNLKYVV